MLTDRQLKQKSFDEVNELNRKNLGDGYAPITLPTEEPEAVTVRDVVGVIVHRFRLPAEVVWRHTLPDLLLMLVEPREEEAVDVRRREVAEHLKRLEPRARLELERLIDEHT